MMDQEYKIRDVLTVDATEIAQIYNHYISHTIITFEEENVSGDVISARIEAARLSHLPWIVAEQEGNILGYAYASEWNGRSAYRYSKEVTVYVSPDHVGKGLGSALYKRLLSALKSCGIHVAIAGISLPNEASIKLHERMGFSKVAQFSEVGFKFDRWIDVGYWQRIL